MTLSDTLYQQPDPAQLDRQLREYLPLVKQIALHLSARLPASIELDDLMQAGMMGLLHACEQYRAEAGASFRTYASIRIKGAMLDELRRGDWLPRRIQRELRRVAEAVDLAGARTGGQPGERDIAETLGMSLADYQALAGELACARMLPLGEEDLELLPKGEDPAGLADSQRFREQLAICVAELPDREQLMMALYYDEGLNLKEVGAVLGVSESRVSQLHGQALARLRSALRGWLA